MGALLAGGVACGPLETAEPPLGETLVIVDTDMPVPQLVSRLRIDIYDGNGVWYETRDFARTRVADWPTSFGVYAPDMNGARVATIRLRAYPNDGTRDYRGERFAPRPVLAPGVDALLDPPLPTPNDQPRLVDENRADVTPATEPQPLLTIDRLVRVEVHPGERGAVRIVLRGSCVGTMADLRGNRTCIEREGVLEPVTPSPLDPNRAVTAPTVAGSFEPPKPCVGTPRPPTSAADGTPLFDDEVCVPGAMFRLGTIDGVFGHAPDLPERIAILDPFFVDRQEVTVARYRKALAAGFASPDATPAVNDFDFPSASTPILDDPLLCSFSSAPRGREKNALTCISHLAARAFCRSQGGDLPTEAQWEYIAAVAARPYRTRFAWGGSDEVAPPCSRAAWGRGPRIYNGQICLTSKEFGPLPVDARIGPDGDVTPGLGIFNLGAGTAEWTRDAFAPMTSNCWAAASLREPWCDAPTGDRTLRGGAWSDNIASLVVANRRRENVGSGSIGFRCVRPARGPR